jgi:predicted lipid-binding transport protein (Tim44 family)
LSDFSIKFKLIPNFTEAQTKMRGFIKGLSPLLFLFIIFSLVEAGLLTNYADARSRFGGKSFKQSVPKQQQVAPNRMKQQDQKKSGFGAGLAGGLLGGAIGGMLLGSMFGMGGSGMGILPILLLGVAGYFIYRKFRAKPVTAPGSAAYQPPSGGDGFLAGRTGNSVNNLPPIPPIQGTPVQETPVQEFTADSGLNQIHQSDSDFDRKYFMEVASDVFFKVQAGWMRRDISSFGHLLGDTLVNEYEHHFSEMKEKGEINKLENIAVRRAEIVDAGSDGQEDFVTVLFAANLLDYTVNDTAGELLRGSMTDPVKFAERWTWARPAGSQGWKLEGIEVADS